MPKRPVDFLRSALISVVCLVFMACNSTAFNKSTGGGVEGYDGMSSGGEEGYDGLVPFQQLGICADGNNVVSEIDASLGPNIKAFLIRNACQTLASPLPLDSSQITIVTSGPQPQLIYQGQTYTSPPPSPTITTSGALTCVSGDGQVDFVLFYGGTTAQLTTGMSAGSGIYTMVNVGIQPTMIFMGSDPRGGIYFSYPAGSAGTFLGSITYSDNLDPLYNWGETVKCTQ
jgi:hypothetical protein